MTPEQATTDLTGAINETPTTSPFEWVNSGTYALGTWTASKSAELDSLQGEAALAAIVDRITKDPIQSWLAGQIAGNSHQVDAGIIDNLEAELQSNTFLCTAD